MEGGITMKKRKMNYRDEDKEEEDEQEMEKFFALIKRIRESRDQQVAIHKANNNKKRRPPPPPAIDDRGDGIPEKPKGGVVLWKPSFQREDFMPDIIIHHNHQLLITTKSPSAHAPLVPPIKDDQTSSSTGGPQQKAVKVDAGLDLKLSL